MLLKGKAHYWSGPWLLNRHEMGESWREKPPCLEAIICYCMYWRIFSFRESTWFTHQKGCSEIHKKKEQKHLHMPLSQ